MTDDKMKARKRTWWRKDGPVTHRTYGHGVITNFVACPSGAANVFFYRGEKVLECWRQECKPAGPDWTDYKSDPK